MSKPSSLLEYFIVLDLETTGLDVTADQPLQIFAAVYHLEHLYRPISSIEIIVRDETGRGAETTHIHGITPAISSVGTSSTRALKQLMSWLGSSLFEFGPDTPLVVYNAAYDLSILWTIAERLRLRKLLSVLESALVLDPLVIDKQLDKFRKGSRSLTAYAERFELVPPELLLMAHDARIDCEILARVVVDVVERNHLQTADLSTMHSNQIEWADQQKLSYAKFSGKDLSHELGWPVQNRVK